MEGSPILYVNFSPDFCNYSVVIDTKCGSIENLHWTNKETKIDLWREYLSIFKNEPSYFDSPEYQAAKAAKAKEMAAKEAKAKKMAKQQAIEDAKTEAYKHDLFLKALREYNEALAYQALDQCQYLIKKNVDRYAPNTRAAYNPSSKTLLIPIYDANGEIVGIEKIYKKNGKVSKRILGKMGGNFGAIGWGIDDASAVNFFYVVEGLTTGLSVHAATKKPVIVAINAGNIDKAIQGFLKYWEEKNPNSPQPSFTIAADNDQWHDKKNQQGVKKESHEINAGIYAAQEAIEKLAPQGVQVNYCYPEFSKENEKENPTDYNDLHVLEGLMAVVDKMKPIEHTAYAVSDHAPQIEAPATPAQEQQLNSPVLSTDQPPIDLELPPAPPMEVYDHGQEFSTECPPDYFTDQAPPMEVYDQDCFVEVDPAPQECPPEYFTAPLYKNYTKEELNPIYGFVPYEAGNPATLFSVQLDELIKAGNVQIKEEHKPSLMWHRFKPEFSKERRSVKPYKVESEYIALTRGFKMLAKHMGRDDYKEFDSIVTPENIIDFLDKFKSDLKQAKTLLSDIYYIYENVIIPELDEAVENPCDSPAIKKALNSYAAKQADTYYYDHKFPSTDLMKMYREALGQGAYENTLYPIIDAQNQQWRVEVLGDISKIKGVKKQTYTGRYIGNIADFMEDAIKVYFLQCLTGAGKTQAVKKLLESLEGNAPFVGVTPLVSLCKSTAIDFGMANYEDMPKGDIKADQIIITPNSLQRLKGLPVGGYILFLDEIEQVFDGYNSNMYKGKFEREQAITAIRYAIKNASHVICADANMTEEVVRETMKYRAKNEGAKLITEHDRLSYRNPHTMTVHIDASTNDHTTFGKVELKILDKAKEKIRFIVGGNISVEYANALKSMILNVWKNCRIHIIHKGNKGSHFNSAVVKDPDHATTCDVFIYTTVLCSGISINDKTPSEDGTPHFKHAFYFFWNQNGGSKTNAQLIARYRPNIPADCFIDGRQFKKETSIKSLYYSNIERVRSQHQAALANGDESHAKELESLILCLENATPDTSSDTLYRHIQANIDCNNFVQNTIGYLRDKYKDVRFDYDKLQRITPPHLEKVKEDIKTKILNSNDVNPQEALELDTKADRTESETHQLTKYKMIDYFKKDNIVQPLTHEIVYKGKFVDLYDIYNDKEIKRYCDNVHKALSRYKQKGIEAYYQYCANKKNGVKNRALIGLIFFTSSNATELAALNAGDLEFKNSGVEVTIKKDGKSHKKLLPVAPKNAPYCLVELLKMQSTGLSKTDPLFLSGKGERIQAIHISRLINKCFGSSDLPHLDNAKIALNHVLRLMLSEFYNIERKTFKRGGINEEQADKLCGYISQYEHVLKRNGIIKGEPPESQSYILKHCFKNAFGMGIETDRKQKNKVKYNIYKISADTKANLKALLNLLEPQESVHDGSDFFSSEVLGVGNVDTYSENIIIKEAS